MPNMWCVVLEWTYLKWAVGNTSTTQLPVICFSDFGFFNQSESFLVLTSLEQITRCIAVISRCEPFTLLALEFAGG